MTIQNDTPVSPAGKNRKVKGSRLAKVLVMHEVIDKANLDDPSTIDIAVERAYNALTDACKSASDGSPLRTIVFSERMALAKAAVMKLYKCRMLC